jgi:hypothetical protein
MSNHRPSNLVLALNVVCPLCRAGATRPCMSMANGQRRLPIATPHRERVAKGREAAGNTPGASSVDTSMKHSEVRRAVASGDARTVAAYLPSNYRVVRETQDGVLIEGTDQLGWGLDSYVKPRLASGFIGCRELDENEDPDEYAPEQHSQHDGVIASND